jgi:ABC-type sulfate transport system permease subunit
MTRRRRPLWRGRTPDPGLAVLPLAALAVLLGLALLRRLMVVFQHAFLNSYWYVPGAHVASTYWDAVRFALHATLLVVALLAVCVGLAVAWAAAQAGRRRRWR